MAGALAPLTLAAAIAGGAQAKVRLFSFDPADDSTRHVAGQLTFEVDQRLMFVKVLKILSTQGEATAILKPVGEEVLGPGGLSRLGGPQGRERDLYEVEQTAEGADLARAFCPGSARVWLAFGRVSEGRDVRVLALGRGPGTGPARLCRTLAFSYHGEWRIPQGQPVRDRDLRVPKFPY